jgi:hypothetical protein
MKRILAAALVAVVGSSVLVGCGTGSQGGPGAANKGGVTSPADEAFTLSVPTLSTKLKQGEARVVEVGIKRGKNFGQDVAVHLDGLPKGVSADPASPDIKAGQDEAKVTLKAADDAALGDFTVKVTGHPKTGADATNEFKLTVEKK